MKEAGSRRAVFLDKDGTLVEDLPYNVDPARLRFTPHAVEALRLLQSHGYLLIVATNQPGIALGHFDRAALARLQAGLTRMLADEGITLHGFHACPHAASPDPKRPHCLCRKPAPGLLRQGALAHGADLARSWMVGDILNDVEAGRRAGCRTVLLDVGNETEWLMSPLREPHHRCRDLLEAAHTIVQADQHQPTPNDSDHAATTAA
ncbi:D-glycero-alpha-D-manno-heptose-1,7-bisphosphate 7-phosphatase [Ideonella sp. BN130291]|uniref:D-glycero-alpha-D-manno-heptose-1,7-bisphosphate 7-phosphatase n=1 Tax=Ideonella sp. BN130291 TaxID=3112940 RepID=UPI002E25F680|nr:HAD family hydrolase [Ideonella sp. BN130291]